MQYFDWGVILSYTFNQGTLWGTETGMFRI